MHQPALHGIQASQSSCALKKGLRFVLGTDLADVLCTNASPLAREPQCALTDQLGLLNSCECGRAQILNRAIILARLM